MVKFACYSISPKIEELKDTLAKEKIDWIKSQIPEGESDLIIAFGGDGEVLKMFHEYPDKMLFGIKIEDGQSLGFYSAINLNEVNENTIESIKNDKFHILSLPLLDCLVGDKHYKILNDVCIQRKPNGKAGRFNVDVGGDVFRAIGDGVILSTPGGSSSYNFASGGSIISWDLHAYSARFFNLTSGLRSVSIVVPGNTITKVESLYESFIEIDGFGLELEPKTLVTTKLSNDCARILCLEYHGQLERLKRMIRSTKLE